MKSFALSCLLALTLYGASQESFKYDKALPLDAHEHEVALRGGVRIVLLNIAVTANVRADGLLVAPERVKAKTGAIVWMHSAGFFEQMPDAILLAQAGAISLLINPIVPDWSAPSETWQGSMIEAVISVRRGIDLLLERSDVDRNARRTLVTVTAR